MKTSPNNEVIRHIATWIEREAIENPHSEIRVSLHVHGGKVAKIERGTIAKLNLEKAQSRAL
jgi:hypothetical protein